MHIRFEWDLNKAAANFRKHGITFEEASSVFRDTLSITVFDPYHSGDEYRQILLGESYSGKLLVVVFTERGDRVRIISARLATQRERWRYEES